MGQLLAEDRAADRPAGAAPLVKAIAAGADPVAMQRLLEIPKGENPANILKEQNEVTAKNLNTAINVAFAPFLGSMVGLQKDRDFAGYAAFGPQAGRALCPRWHGAVGGRDQGLQRPHRQPLRFPRYLPDSEKPADQSRRHPARRLRSDEENCCALKQRRCASPFGNVQLRSTISASPTTRPNPAAAIARDGVFVTSPRNDGLNIAVRKQVRQERRRPADPAGLGPAAEAGRQPRKPPRPKSAAPRSAASSRHDRRLHRARRWRRSAKASDFSTSMVDRLGAQWADTLDPKNSLSGMWLGRRAARPSPAAACHGR